VTAVDRLDATLAYARAADQLGLDVFALGEHHSHKFAVASPAVVLAAIAGQTERIRLTSGVTVLSALDPVRVYQDFAQLDLLSHGRAEIIAGRSAFAEPFALFGAPMNEYDELMIGTADQLTEKILDAQDQLGITRFIGQFDWGGLPATRAHESIARLATEIAPAVRAGARVTLA
jgi:hypothetical protein